jgi:hypothetical protein
MARVTQTLCGHSDPCLKEDYTIQGLEMVNLVWQGSHKHLWTQ